MKIPCFNCDGLGYIQMGVSKIPCPTCKGKKLLTEKEERKSTISKYAKNFTIEQNKSKNKPYYNVYIKMDSNDADFISDDIAYDVDEWNKKPDIFFLMIAYLGQGYSGIFSHDQNWGDYYGHHWAENKHGLSEIISEVAEFENWFQFSDWGKCHSFSDIIITYFDEENRKHDVTYKTVDDLFNTEEEMIEAIKEAYDRWNETFDE